MNFCFVEDLLYSLTDGIEINQNGIMNLLIDGQTNDFPMISFEHTPDSDFEVDVNESKFLTDQSHEGTWIFGGTQDDIDYIMCLKECDKNLKIDVFEVNINKRQQGIGSNILSIVELAALNYYDKIIVSPFDTGAINFWEHMEFHESNNGNWVKKLI